MVSTTDAVPERDRPGNHNVKRLLVVALLVICAALGYRWFQSSSGLARYASPVPKVDAMQVFDLPDYQWQAPDTLFVLVPGGPQGTSCQPALIATRTGERKPLSALATQLGARTLRQARSFLVSPDGKWVLFLNGQGAAVHWMAAALDGSRLIQWPGIKPDADAAHPVWLPDSRHWINFAQGRKGSIVQTCSIDTPAVTERPAAIEIGKAPWVGAAPDGQILAGAMTLPKGLMPEVAGEKLVFTPDASAFATLNFVRMALDGSVPAKHVTIQMPKGAVPKEVALSPQADKFAMMVQFYHAAASATQGADASDKLRITESIWEGRLDGSGLHKLGSEVSGQSDPVSNIQWTPDGKRISFLYKQALYTLPAD